MQCRTGGGMTSKIPKPALNSKDVSIPTSQLTWNTVGNGLKSAVLSNQTIFGRNDIRFVQVIDWGGGAPEWAQLDAGGSQTIFFAMVQPESSDTKYIRIRGFF